MIKFDFDEWANLYRTSPAEFELRRKELLDAEIAKAPIERRMQLRLLQIECDVLSETLPPLQATNEISKLMVDKIFDLQDAFLDLGIACKEYDIVNKSKDK